MRKTNKIMGFAPLEITAISQQADSGLDRSKYFLARFMKNRRSPKGDLSLTGFTLMELMIVVVVIGVLVSIAWPRYILIVEKSRTAEAKDVLGQIREAEMGYFMEYDSYTINIALLSLGVPTSCNTSFYYNYGIAGGGASFTATATRCTAGGKAPNSPGGVAYVLNITQNGVLGGTPPYV